MVNPSSAISFVRKHGVVLASAKGPVPRLTEFIVGRPVKGSWWADPETHRIFRVLKAVTASPDILVCRLVSGKVTLVHRRLWPALVRAKSKFLAAQLAEVHDRHTASGHHITETVPFPKWVPSSVMKQAQRLSLEEAIDELEKAGVMPMTKVRRKKPKPPTLKIGMVATADYGPKMAPFDQKTLALWAADCAKHVLGQFERRRPKDDRPRNAIAAARAWARGKITMMMARTAAVAAHAAARAANHPAAIAAARAAGHAAATAHSIRHARGPAIYAIVAVVAATVPDQTESVTSAERGWQLEQLGRLRVKVKGEK